MRRKLVFDKRKNKIVSYLNDRIFLYNELNLDFVVIKLINYLMTDGKKRKALGVLEGSFYLLKKWTLLSPFYIIKKAISNCFFLFDHRVLPVKKNNKKKSNVGKVMHVFGFINSNLRIKRAIKFVYTFSSSLVNKNNKSITFTERFALGLLFIFFKKGFFFKELKNLYKLLLLNKLKLKEIFNLQKTTRRFLIKVKRRRKEKGFFLFNPYSLSPWYKEVDRYNFRSRA